MREPANGCNSQLVTGIQPLSGGTREVGRIIDVDYDTGYKSGLPR
jgi:hypothetical protein